VGDIDIGSMRYAGRRPHPFGIKLHELTRHTGIFGSTGMLLFIWGTMLQFFLFNDFGFGNSFLYGRKIIHAFFRGN
jgi:hypothetical protein